MVDKIEELRERLLNNGLRISRIPDKARERFIELANSDFASDFGMCVKYLLDFHDGILFNGYDSIVQTLDRLEGRIIALEGNILTTKIMSGMRFILCLEQKLDE